MFIHNIYKTLSNSIIFTINPNICWILSTRGSTHKEDRPIIFLTQIEHSIYISEDNLIGIIYCLRMIEWRIWDQLRTCCIDTPSSPMTTPGRSLSSVR